VLVEARNGKAVSLTVPPGGFVIYWLGEPELMWSNHLKVAQVSNELNLRLRLG
jgi:hypothetical protein